ncbi:hypothetical protein [Silvanigrella aquatica]|uniref:hypothetical protein n=1 Tax=Silvanigrella aquatica TaxID=1915309 RepID=UPI0011E5D2FB|nr:hypothetical protein [Silvanigrella aquatica]
MFLLHDIICALATLFVSLTGFADDTSSLKKSAPIYQNPFDLASGGATLTRATQEGVMFSNPSLPAFGDGVFRSIFYVNKVSVGEGALAAGQDVIQAASNPSSNSVLKTLLEDTFKKPIYGQLDTVVGALTSHFGVAGFATNKLDLNGQEFGTMGLPVLEVKNNGVAGVASTFSTSLGDYLAVGVGPKYVYNTEVNTNLSVSDVTDPTQATQKITNALKKGSGVSTNVGVTLQNRTKYFDMRVAGVVEDLGNTAFTGGVPPWLQTYNAGVGFALHDMTNALHCALDYRDITDVYGEDLPKKIYMGCKLLLTRYVGFSAGYLQGWPSYGMVLNLYIFRIEAGSYTKDGANQSGLAARKIYFASLGFEI